MGSGVSGRFSETKGGCFIAGTMVLTDHGLQSIETIKIGDAVFSKNTETDETGFKKVVETFVHMATDLVCLRCGDISIKATLEHPFWVQNEGWKYAEDLKKGDLLTDMEGQPVVVEQVERVTESEEVLVYNFHVEDFCTYYVSRLNLLVHNNSGNKKGGKPSNKPYKNNNEANKQAQKHGYDNAHKLKEYFVGKKNVAKFDMKYDTKTGEIYLESKDGKIQLRTGLKHES